MQYQAPLAALARRQPARRDQPAEAGGGVVSADRRPGSGARGRSGRRRDLGQQAVDQARISDRGIWPLVILAVLVGVGWFGGRTLFRLAENSFWSLNSLAVQPAYTM